MEKIEPWTTIRKIGIRKLKNKAETQTSEKLGPKDKTEDKNKEQC